MERPNYLSKAGAITMIVFGGISLFLSLVCLIASSTIAIVNESLNGVAGVIFAFVFVFMFAGIPLLIVGLGKLIKIKNYNQRLKSEYVSKQKEEKLQKKNQSLQYDELLKLKKLLDEGIISNDEYEAKKQQILGLK